MVLFAAVFATGSNDASLGRIEDEAAFRAFRFNHGSSHVEFCHTLAVEAGQPNSGCAASSAGRRRRTNHKGIDRTATSTLSSSRSFSSSSSSSTQDNEFLWDSAMHDSSIRDSSGEGLSTRRYLSEVLTVLGLLFIL